MTHRSKALRRVFFFKANAWGQTLNSFLLECQSNPVADDLKRLGEIHRDILCRDLLVKAGYDTESQNPRRWSHTPPGQRKVVLFDYILVCMTKPANCSSEIQLTLECGCFNFPHIQKFDHPKSR